MSSLRSRSRKPHEDKTHHLKSKEDEYDETLQIGSPWRVKLEKFAYQRKYGKKDWAHFWAKDYGHSHGVHLSLSSSEKQDGADPDDYSPSLTPDIFRDLMRKYGLGSFNWGGKVDVKRLDRMMRTAAETRYERWTETEERCSHREFDEMKEKYGLRHVPIVWDRNKTPEEYEAIMRDEAREREEWVRRNRESYRPRREERRRDRRRDVDAYRTRREKPRRLMGRRDDERVVQEEIEKRSAGSRDGRKGERRDRARVGKQREEVTSGRVLRSASIVSKGIQG